MKFNKTRIKGLFIIEPTKFSDERGYFLKSFEKQIFQDQGINFEISQINHSFNKQKATLRGMHMQKKPFEEAKIVQCIKGSVLDVAIDMRKGSETFGKWEAVELSENNNTIFYIPEGFAHGFETLEENSEVLYFMTGKYSKEHELGFRWDDPFFGITWPLKPLVIADKDQAWSLIKK